MADQDIDGILQRMIDAGKSKEEVGAAYQALMAEAEAAPQVVSASEPDTYLGGALKGLKEGAIGGAKGFVKGVVPGMIDGAKEIIKSPITIGKGLLDAGMGAYHMATDPAKTSHEAIDAISSIPGKVSDMVSSAAQKAAIDPEGFGNDIGRLTGTAEAGILAGKVIPLAPKPLARKIGEVAEQVGTKGAWPIRIMGAHQLGSGNPMGIVTMTAPEMLQKTGQKLQEFGAPPSRATGGTRPYTGPYNPPEVDTPLSGLSPKARAMAEEMIASGKIRRKVDYPELGQGPAPSIASRQAAEPTGSIRITSKAATDLADGRVPAASKAPVPSDTRLDELAGKLGGAAGEAPKPARIATQEGIPASKSKGAMSATPGLTRADLEAVGLNPALNYKDLTPDLIAKIKELRSSRHGTNYANAVTDKGLRSILEESLLMRNMERLR